MHRERRNSEAAKALRARCASRAPEHNLGQFVVWRRPHAAEFLEFCLEHFDVAVFSSVRARNIRPLIDLLFGERKRELVFVWDQTSCEVFGSDPEKPDKPLFLKPFSRIVDEFGARYGDTRVLIVDDSPYKCLRNPPGTAIHPSPWDPTQEADAGLGEGAPLRRFLEALRGATDVPSFVLREAGELGEGGGVHGDILAQLDSHFGGLAV